MVTVRSAFVHADSMDTQHETSEPTMPASPQSHEHGITETWPELPDMTKYIKRAGWQKRPMPNTLHQLPDDIVISEKVRHILQWSMLAGSDWATKPPELTVSITDTDTKDQDSLRRLSDDKGARSEADNSSIYSKRQGSEDGSISHSSTNDRSAWASRLRHKLGRKTPTVASSSQAPPPLLTAECTCCFDDVPIRDLVRLQSCRHYYCETCLTTLILTAMASESSFPPKCCLNAIPLQTVLLALNTSQRETYKVKSAEYSIPPNERWYCPNTTCAKWLPPSKLRSHWGSTVKCPHCSEKMCRTCRGSAHSNNAECPQDFGLQATLEMADVEGWMRCYSCRALVEHTTGCRHMTCKCKAQFCYVCGAKWSTCHCSETDANRKKADVQRRRDARYVQIDAEAAEIARAIAEIQEMELREAETRHLEEERVAREEQEMLEVVELQRLAEEAARQAAAEQAELDRMTAIRASFEEEYKHMHDVIWQINEFQKIALSKKHDDEIRTKIRDAEPLGEVNLEKLDKLLGKLNQKYRTRFDNLTAAQEEEKLALAVQQEEEEDDLFIQVQIRLRGKPNREARTERMLEELRKQQGDKREELQKSHDAATTQLRANEETDVEGIRRAQLIEKATSRDRRRQTIYGLGFTIGADRMYYELVSARRLSMLARYGELAVIQIEQKLEPTSLLDWQAATCEPLLPEVDDGAPGPSGIQRWQRKSVAGTNHLKPSLDGKRPERASRNSYMAAVSPGGQTNKSYDKTQETSESTVDKRLPGSFPDGDAIIDIVGERLPSPLEAISPLPQLSSGSDSDDHIVRRKSNNSICLTPKSSFISAREDMVVIEAEQPFHIGDDVLTDIVTRPEVKIESEVSLSHVRRSSAISSTATVDTQGDTTRYAATKKSKWSLGRKSKELTPEQFRQRMRETVGDAF